MFEPSQDIRLRQAAHRCALHIAIDGTAGAGKSTLGLNLARALDCAYLDTGLMYRAAALAALRARVDVDRPELVVDAARALRFELDSADPTHLLVDGAPAPAALRSAEVDAAVSPVAAIPELRRIMVSRQRELAEGRCIVMAGRDIGSAVLPQAPIKLWLTASSTVRALRRLQEGVTDTHEISAAEMQRRLEARDTLDAGRTSSPLQRPANATTITTDTITPQEALHQALRAIEEYLRAKRAS